MQLKEGYLLIFHSKKTAIGFYCNFVVGITPKAQINLEKAVSLIKERLVN